MNLESLNEFGKFEWIWKVDQILEITLTLIWNLRWIFQLQSQLSKFIQTFLPQRNYPTSKEAFQLRSVLSNFNWFFPTSRSFQLLFPTKRISYLNVDIYQKVDIDKSDNSQSHILIIIYKLILEKINKKIFQILGRFLDLIFSIRTILWILSTLGTVPVKMFRL